jgi:quercetin dioxygenase-like cupin family protein
MRWSWVPAGSGIPLHTHQNEDEIFQVVEGSLEVTVDGRVHLLENGDMIFLPRLVPHGFKALSAVKMWVSFTPGGVERMFIELATLPPGPPDPVALRAIGGRYGITFG